jgi:hypothetical protein
MLDFMYNLLNLMVRIHDVVIPSLRLPGGPMHNAEKQAWFTLVVLAAAALSAAGLILMRGGWAPASEALGLLGLLGLVPFFGWKARRAGRVLEDERDREIARTASSVGFAAVWVLLVLALLTPLFLKGPGATLTLRTDRVPLLIVPAWMVVMGVRAVVTLVLHRRGLDDGEAQHG